MIKRIAKHSLKVMGRNELIKLVGREGREGSGITLGVFGEFDLMDIGIGGLLAPEPQSEAWMTLSLKLGASAMFSAVQAFLAMGAMVLVFEKRTSL